MVETIQQVSPLEVAEARCAALRDAITEKVLNNVDFTSEVVALAAAAAAYQELRRKGNEVAINNAASKLGADILALTAESGLEALMGEAISSVYWTFTPGSGENGPILSCSVNVKARQVPAKKESSAGTGSGRASLGKFSVDGGAEISARDFVVTYGPPEVQTDGLVVADAAGNRKWPTKPSFLEATAKHLVATGHTVVHNT